MLGISFLKILYKVHGAAGVEVVVSSGNIDRIIMIMIYFFNFFFFYSLDSRLQSRIDVIYIALIGYCLSRSGITSL